MTWMRDQPGRFHYELHPVFNSRLQSLETLTFAVAGDSYRLTDPKSPLTRQNNKHQLFQNIDRLNVQYHFAKGDLTIGRQAISFGSARIINPTDVFIPFDVRTFNQEYRIGVDAVRYQAPVGELGEFDTGIVLGNTAAESAVFLQLRGNAVGNDLQFALARFAQQNMIGGGIQSALGEFGFWFEAAYVTGDRDYWRVSTGLDYSFSGNTVGQLEYHFNGAGSDNPDDYLSQLTTIAYRRGGVFLLGEDYVIPSFTLRVSPLWGVGVQGIINLSDRSSFISLSTEYNVAENVYIDLGYYRFSGHSITATPMGLPLLRSEYGSSPNVGFFSVRFYF